MRTLVARVATAAIIGFMILGAFAAPALASLMPNSPPNEVFFFSFSGTACTSSTPTNLANDGQPSGEMVNNVGGPPETAVIGNWQTMCIQVMLAGVAHSTTYTITVAGGVSIGTCQVTT